MKNSILSIVTVVVVLMSSCASMKEGNPVKQVVSIQTNAQCGDCKDRIEKELNFTKGVILADLDLDTKIVEIKYSTKRTSPEKLREVISSIGYNADEVKANEQAQSELPKCCQPGGHD